MPILRKSKKDREYEKEKDLSEKNTKSRSRKESKKPWGRKERLLVLFILVITIGSSAILALSSRAWKLPGLPRFKLPTINLPFVGEETIIIEGDKERLEKTSRSKEAIQRFKEQTGDLSGVYGLYVVDLDTGFSFGVNEKEVFEPASLNKLPVIVALYMEAEKGSLDLESKYKLKNSDKVTGAGSLITRPEGYEITYRNLIRLMGKQSDNTAFNIAKNLLGEEKIEQAILRIGMKDTSLTKNETTPVDIGIFFEELWHGNIVSPEHRDELLEFLTDTLYESWITQGVPDEIRVAHKYGREIHVVNDAGVIYANKPFVLVIMSKGAIEREADLIFPGLARIVYEAETRY